jgi:hypothetical protein
MLLCENQQLRLQIRVRAWTMSGNAMWMPKMSGTKA